MLNKFFKVVAILGLISVLFSLYYSQRRNLVYFPAIENQSNEDFKTLRLSADANEIEASPGKKVFMKSEAAKATDGTTRTEASQVTEAPKGVQEKTQPPAHENKTLGPCPDTPPKLVGALRVDFNHNMTLDKVREEVGAPLQMGGSYKPHDCIAKQKVAIIIPFRNRHEHLKHWLYYLHPILIRQQVDYSVYVINQDGEGIFNKAKLMNVGFAEALKRNVHDCFVFYDVDLVPMDDRNLYRCFDNPSHLSVGMDKFEFQLPYDSFLGGVISLSKEQFLKINGFSNTYWGWGGEDDDIYNRIVFNNLTISRPDPKIARYKMLRHQRDLHNERNLKNVRKLQQTRQTMSTDGINSLNYTVKEIVRDKLYTFITVDIQAPLSLAQLK